MTGDNLVDGDDLLAWLAAAGRVNFGVAEALRLGDANLDGFVDVSDFSLWNSNKFTAATAWSAADFNADGVVDVSDFSLWNGNKFTTAVSASRSSLPAPTVSLRPWQHGNDDQRQHVGDSRWAIDELFALDELSHEPVAYAS